jgi:hypothetical protein
MPALSVVWGVVAFLAMLITLLPPLQPLNWVVLPLAALGVLLNLLVVIRRPSRGHPLGLAGLTAAGVALVISIVRATINPGQL